MAQTTAAAPAGLALAPDSADLERLRELQRITHETEQSYETLTQQLRKISSKIHSEALRVKRAEAAVEALEGAGPDCVACQQIARLFVFTPPQQLEKQLTQERERVLERDLPRLEALKGQLMARLRSVVTQRTEARKEYEAIVLKLCPQAAGGGSQTAAAAATAAAARAAGERGQAAQKINTSSC